MPRLPLRTRRRSDTAFRLSVLPLEVRALPSACHFDFDTPTSPVASGYIGVPVLLYNPTLGVLPLLVRTGRELTTRDQSLGFPGALVFFGDG